MRNKLTVARVVAIVLISLGLQLVFPPLRLVTPVNVIGRGLSHYGEHREDLGGGHGRETRLGFAPASGDEIICDLGHFPIWYVVSRRSGEDQSIDIYSATMVGGSRKSYGYALHDMAHVRVDWTRLFAEEALILAICACLLAIRRDATAE